MALRFVLAQHFDFLAKEEIMKVECEIEQVELEATNGAPVDSVRATCERCQHTTESFGTGEKSVKRCLVLMRQECPEGEENF